MTLLAAHGKVVTRPRALLAMEWMPPWLDVLLMWVGSLGVVFNALRLRRIEPRPAPMARSQQVDHAT